MRPLSLRIAVPLFACTLFSGAFLMFLVEPMVAKMVLPQLGGAPMVWNTCVVFFQAMLLAGYACAHGATAWLDVRRLTLGYGLLLLVPLVVLPFAIGGNGAAPPSEGSPVAWLLLTLLTAIGLPFFVLATGASTFQTLFATTDHPAAGDPYFLYVASNLGSLLALVAYPGIVETTLRLSHQSLIWTAGYAVFVVMALACLVLVRTRQTVPGISADSAARTAAAAARPDQLTWRRRAKWVVLAFIPSSLMLAVTAYLSTDIAAVPLLWIIPLAIYLLTFVLAFGARSATYRAVADRRLPLVMVVLAVFIIVHAVGPIWLVSSLHVLAFAMSAMLCHGDLAADRPGPARLTEFYFWVAFGGMLGGLFNTLAAPLLFKTVLEYPLVLVLACFFRRSSGSTHQSGHDSVMDVAWVMGVAVLTAGSILYLHRIGGPVRLALYVPALLCLSQLKRPVRFALIVSALVLVGLLTPGADRYGQVLHVERTFFGVYRISLDPTGRFYTLFHGTTLHGMEFVDPAHKGEPLTYYHRQGPFGQALAALPAVSSAPDVAVVGLGVGSLAAYAGPDQRWTFFEIDPAVERMARNPEHFTFLRTCGDRCQVLLGDARLSLARLRSSQYGLIVLDAFSSDSIPVHLMTTEAFTLYLSRLASGGVLAFHISNRHLKLAPVVSRLAANHGLALVEREETMTSEVVADGRTGSHWVILARDRRDLGGLVDNPMWATQQVSPSTPLWTDDFSNILSVLSLR